MSYPILYESTETAFADNGLGILSDAVSCAVTEERNGLFELQMTYPVDGIHYADIALERILLAKPNPIDRAQPFRIYRITTPMGGAVTIYAQHISYDLAGIPVNTFTAASAADAMSKLAANAAMPCPFELWTDKTTSGQMTVAVPAGLRSLLGGTAGSVLDVYGGEYKFDRYTVRLYDQRGENRGVSIRYGKNLMSIEQETNCAAVYAGVYPYWAGPEGALAVLPEKIIMAGGSPAVKRIRILDLSAEFQEQPTEAQLRSRAQAYIRDNDVTVPKVSLTVSYVQLEQTEEYKGKALLERVELCDTVNIEFPKLGVSATAKAISMTYNVLLDRVESVSFGDARRTLADELIDQRTAADAAIKQSAAATRSFLQKAIDDTTDQITGNHGGYVILHSSTGQKEPDEILIMDTPDINTAVNVWRWNKAGLGYSSHGYNGPYSTAITADGKIVADFITAGTMAANRIKGGTLTLGGSGNGNGVLRINDAAGNQVGYIDNTGIHFTSGSISLGNGAFTVSSDGKVTANTGVFAGEVYAKNIGVGGDKGYVSGSQIGSGAVGSDNLGWGSVLQDKLADGSVNAPKIVNGAIGNAKIAGGAVSEAKCDATIQGYFADIITANKIFAGTQFVEKMLVSEAQINTLHIGSTTSISTASATFTMANGKEQTIRYCTWFPA